MTTIGSRARLWAVGAALVFPIVLLAGALIVAERQVTVAAMTGGQQEPPPGVYAQGFSMTIFEQGRTVQLWLVDLDTAPYFRQTVSTDGQVESDQIYRFDERTLYTAEAEVPDGSRWNSITPVEPQDLGLADLATGPAAWAAEFGPGEHEISVGQGVVVRVLIDSVDEPIDSTVFMVPPGAAVTPVQP